MVDDLPVGKSGANDMFREEMERLAREEAESNQGDLPLAERLQSKTASVKAAAFEELTAQLEAIADDDCGNAIFAEHPGDLWCQYLSDNQVLSLEKVQEAFKLYLAKAHQDCFAAQQQELLNVLVEKNMMVSRPSIKETAIELAVAIFAATENFDEASLGTLDELFKSKKSVVSSFLIQIFGRSTFKP